MKTDEKLRQEAMIKDEKNTTENVQQLLEEINVLKNALDYRDEEILNLKVENQAAKEVSEKLSKALSEEIAKVLENDQLTEKYKSVGNNLEKANKELEKENKSLAENILIDRNKWEQELELKVNGPIEANIENKKLKEKVDSLLHVLYDCPECGLNSCECIESAESESISEIVQPSDVTFEVSSTTFSSPKISESSR